MSAPKPAAAVLSCPDLDAELAWFTGRLGFRLDAIRPADGPVEAEISGHGIHLVLRRGEAGPPGRLRLAVENPAGWGNGDRELASPGGTRIEIVETEPPLALPPFVPEWVITRRSDGETWQVGRAGMLYRDLLPGRLGGAVIASRIRIPEGGPVPDAVHFHRVDFQMIHCLQGWVRLVYEDQGPPFVLEAGDGVLQPPGIRHRVLECSPGLEVIEITRPAEHETCLDHDLSLPTEALRPDRSFEGQPFLHYRASAAGYEPDRRGFTSRDTGMAAATGGRVDVRILRAGGIACGDFFPQGAGPLLLVPLRGSMTLRRPGEEDAVLGEGDCAAVPAGAPHALAAAADGMEFLQVAFPAHA